MVRESIKQIKNSCLFLAEALDIVDTLIASLDKLRDNEIGRIVGDKFNNLLSNILDFYICIPLVC